MITLKLALPSASYPIHIGRGLLNNTSLILPYLPIPQIAVITNTVVAAHYLAHFTAPLTEAGIECIPIILPDGEQAKAWSSLDEIFTALLSHHCERATTLIALGGGVIGDIAGFAAACYQRGTPLIHIPTTLLAQVDSSIGGKTAINHPLGKNMIGAFYQPRAVLIDLAVLATLPEREYCAGLAEVIKYALLGDAEFFLWLETHIDALRAQDGEALQYAVQHCCEMKAALVATDEKEAGQRALLNLGHTFGHAIEAGLGFGTWLHGEAVAAGLVLAAAASKELGWLSQEYFTRIRILLKKAGLPVHAPDLGVANWKRLIRHDKKVEQGVVRFILLNGIGKAVIERGLADQVLERILTGECIARA